MAEQHTVRVVVEGDTASLNSALSRSSAEASRFTSTVDKSSAAMAKTSSTAGKTAAAMSGVERASKTLSVALEQSKSGTLAISQVATTAAAAFGPWGIAISVAGGLLLQYAQSSAEAKEKTRKHTRAIEEQKRAASDLAAAKALARFGDTLDARTLASATELTREGIAATEEMIAINRGAGRSNVENERELTRLKAEELRITANLLRSTKELTDAEVAREMVAQRKAITDQADALERGQVLDDLERENKAPRRSSKRGKPEVVQSDEFMAELAASRGPANGPAAIERDDDREFAAELEQAKDAQIAAQIQRDYDSEARAAAAEEAAAKRHEAELARLAARQAAEEKLMARRVALGQMAVGLANSGAQLANMVAKASGASAKKQEAIANRVAGVQAMAIGALEVVQAVAAAASFNVPQAVLHGAAAVVAFAQGGMLLALGGGGGGAASAGGSAVGGGSPGAAPSGGSSPTPGSDSAIPGSPGPQSPKSGSSGSSNGGKSTVINIGEVHTYGTPRREFLSSVAEGLDVDHASQRRRTA